jgi:predicted small metal-binding protein
LVRVGERYAILVAIDQGVSVFEFVCERIIPGCSHVDRGDTREKLLEQAMDHMREHHDMDYIDKSFEERMLAVGIVPLKPQ